jgi:osmoprotectant transport system permease protein
MLQKLRIDKVPFAFSITGLVSLWLLGIATLKPNRLLDGEPVSLLQAADNAMPLVIIGLWLLILLNSVISLPGRMGRYVTLVTAWALWPLYLGTVGGFASSTLSQAGPLARVSLGPATWLGLFLTAFLLSDTWQRCNPRERYFLLASGLAALGTVFAFLLTGRLDELSILREYFNRQDRFFHEMTDHFTLAFGSVALAVSMGLPLGILAHRKAKIRDPLFFILNIFQTIPSLALFGILIPVLAALLELWPTLANFRIQAIGTTPALIALTVYSLLPVARNSYTGFDSVDASAVDAGKGMGMSSTQILLKIEIPIASPIILSGVRIAMVQAIGLTAVAALIGAGGLGVFIFQGLGQAATDLILLGAVPTIIFAVIVDSVMNGLVEVIRPKGLR